MTNPLARLVKQADAVSLRASALLRQTIRDVRGELANLARELNLPGNAADREKAYQAIRRRYARLSRQLDLMLREINTNAAKESARTASKMTGLEVRYSPQRAKAICELVTPAQGENLAAVFTDRMSQHLINSLRAATVATLREQAVGGGSLKDMSREMEAKWRDVAGEENPRFTDAAGRQWNTATYFQMNTRTNAMRVYNDCLVDNVAREAGTDLMRISAGGDPDCDCFAWEGCIVSISGKTKGFPTYEDARNGGCFHPNCTHTLEYVDETADADEIALQKAHPVDPGKADDPDAQDERRYEIDQARYMRDKGMTQEEARVAVDRDNLEAAIRHGLIRGDAREIVDKMTDAQVTALCPDGNPPAFEPFKKCEKGAEKWNHGSAGGVVHISRDADLAHILDVCKVADVKEEEAENPLEAIRENIRNATGRGEKIDPSVVDSLIDVVAKEVGTTKFERTQRESYAAYNPSTDTVVMNGDSQKWSGGAWSACHELGHSYFEKKIKGTKVSIDITNAINADIRNSTKTFTREAIAQDLFGQTYDDARTEMNKRKEIVDILDVISGKTGRRVDGCGHDAGYWRSYIGDKRIEIRANEFFAEAVSALSHQRNGLEGYFPTAFEMVRKTLEL